MMRRLLYIVFVLMFSANCMFAEDKDSLAVSSSVSAGDSAVTDSSDFVRSSIIFLERDKGSAVAFFGHIALRLQCPSAGLDYAFTFTGSEQQAWYDILLGSDLLGLVPTPFHKFVTKYNDEGRSAYEYPLNLTLAENRELWRLVDKYVKKGLYLQDDHMNHGCAQETASLVLSVVNGEIKYGPYADSIGNTYSTLVRSQADEGSWHFLVFYAVSGPDKNRKLNYEERLLLPSDMIEAWKEAKIVDNAGVERNLFKTAAPICYPTGKPMASRQLGYSTVLVFGLVLGIVVVVSLLQLLTSKARMLAKVTDGMLLACVSLLAVALLVIHLFSTLSTMRGWTHSFVDFNLVPLLVWLVSLKRQFAHKVWMQVYAVYSIALILLIVWMFANPVQVDPVEIMIAGTLLVRCMTNVVINKRLNTNDNKQTNRYKQLNTKSKL